MFTRGLVGGCVAVFVAGCGGSSSGSSSTTPAAGERTYGQSAAELFAIGQRHFQNNDCEDAETIFRRVRREFSYSNEAAQAELRIADCLVIRHSYTEAIAAYRQFVRHRPTHEEVPYARFKIAESYAKQIPTDTFFLAAPGHERDQTATREALRQLRRFILDFPSDSRLAEAEALAQRAANQLALHELYVAKYYAERRYPHGAIARLDTMLAAYPGSAYEAEGMLLRARMLDLIGDTTRARAALEELIARHAEAPEARSARDELAHTN